MAQTARQDRPFRHAGHRSVECIACHSSADAHGRLTIAAPRDCQGCHHAQPAVARCVQCHAVPAYTERTYTAAETFGVANRSVTRTLPFEHARHEDVTCTRCHTQPRTLATEPALCRSCHEDHHEVRRECTACHAAPPAEAHPVRVHVTCGGAGCHAANFLVGEPRTREVCLSCHRDQVEHRPGERCADCHVLPPLRVGGAG